MNTNTSKAPIYVLAGLITAAVLGFSFFFLIKPQLDDISAAKDETKQTESANNLLRVTNATLREQATTIPATREEVKRFASKFPGDAAQRELLDNLSALAASTGVKVTGLSAQEPLAGAAPAFGTVAAAPGTLPVSADDGTPIGAAQLVLETTGSEDRTRAFLKALESANRSINQQVVEFAVGQDGKTIMKLSFATYISRPLVEPDQSVLSTPAVD